jgi:hypothetical protein
LKQRLEVLPRASNPVSTVNSKLDSQPVTNSSIPFHNGEEQHKPERKRGENIEKKRRSGRKEKKQKNEGKVEMFAQPPVSSVIRSSPSTLLPAAARPGKLPSCLLK